MAILKDIWRVMTSKEPLKQRGGVVERIAFDPAPNESSLDHWTILFQGESAPFRVRLHHSLPDAARIALALTQAGDLATFGLGPYPSSPEDWLSIFQAFHFQNATLESRLPSLAGAIARPQR